MLLQVSSSVAFSLQMYFYFLYRLSISSIFLVEMMRRHQGPLHCRHLILIATAMRVRAVFSDGRFALRLAASRTKMCDGLIFDTFLAMSIFFIFGGYERYARDINIIARQKGKTHPSSADSIYLLVISLRRRRLWRVCVYLAAIAYWQDGHAVYFIIISESHAPILL